MISFRLIVLAAVVAGAGSALAQPRILALSESDEAAYRAAFEAADAGDSSAVRARLASVEDDALVGTAGGRALLQTDRGAYSQLVDWLQRHPDLAIAHAVFDRAQRIRPRRARPPPAPEPVARRVPPGAPPPPVGDSYAARAQIAAIQERASLGAFDEARTLASEALSGPRGAQAAWLLGLMAFRQRDYVGAARHFEASARWPHHDPASLAGVHYWAVRARLAAGDAAQAAIHLEAAAQWPASFYGQLAEAQLGRDSALRFDTRPLDADALRGFIERWPAARRAAALAQLGRLSDVENELRHLHGRLPPREDATYLALAQALAAPSAQLRAADFGGPELASGHCPITTFEPEGGFALDRALIYAIVRQESYFNPVAVSASNARGLMQLLPSTANDMDRSRGYRRNPSALFEPGENMRLGQAYVLWLMDRFHRDRDLGRVLASYNGGPGWLQRWLASNGDIGDPLLLLEMLPRAESRDYAERVLSHMAICRRKFGQPTPEIDALASGRPAAYEALDARHAPVLQASAAGP